MNVLEKVAEEVETVSTLAELETELHYEFKRAQDMQTYAFHVQGKAGTALCGSSQIFHGLKPITVEGVMLSLPRQNGAWFWCDKCVAAFTGEPEQFFIDVRTGRNK